MAVIGTSKIRVAPGSTYQPGPSFVNVGAADPPVPLTEMVSTLMCRLPVLRTRASTLPFSTETPSITAVRDRLRRPDEHRDADLGAQGHRVSRRRRLIRELLDEQAKRLFDVAGRAGVDADADVARRAGRRARPAWERT